jgi:hypothetical protein
MKSSGVLVICGQWAAAIWAAGTGWGGVRMWTKPFIVFYQ